MATNGTPTHREAARRALAEVAGISDQAILDRLLDAELDAETFPAFRFLPLALIAWSSGSVRGSEKEVVRTATTEISGLGWGTPAYQQLERWLDAKPLDELVALWADYYQAWLQQFEEGHREVLKERLLDDARRVARSAGGVFGIRSVSAEEEAAIDVLRELLDRRASGAGAAPCA